MLKMIHVEVLEHLFEAFIQLFFCHVTVQELVEIHLLCFSWVGKKKLPLGGYCFMHTNTLHLFKQVVQNKWEAWRFPSLNGQQNASLFCCLCFSDKIMILKMEICLQCLGIIYNKVSFEMNSRIQLLKIFCIKDLFETSNRQILLSDF